MQPKNKYLKCVWMNFLKVSILSFFFFLYTDIKYITSILLLLLLRKKYIILIADNSILTSYFIICELWRRHNLRQNHTTRRQTSHFVRVAEKTLPKRVPLHDRHVRNRVSLNCPRCFRRKHALKTRSNASLSDITVARSTDSGSSELRLYYWDFPSCLQNYCYAGSFQLWILFLRPTVERYTEGWMENYFYSGLARKYRRCST